MGTVAGEGRTVLFVSHNMTALQSLCSRAIWLNGGELKMDGPASSVVTKYLQSSAQLTLDRVWADTDETAGNGAVRLNRARIIAADPYHVTVADPLDIEIIYSNLVSDTTLNLSLHLFNLEGVCVFNSISPVRMLPACSVTGLCHIPGDFLNDGYYRIQIMIVKDTSTILLTQNEAMLFEVYDVPR